jgi:serine/threonine-protein kinase HipA
MLHSDLIVKSGGEDYPHLSANEFLCMDAARRAGISVPEFWLSDDSSLFVMKRFDLDGDKPMGFEDMTVLMNLPREPTGHYKYTQSYEAVTRFIRAFCRENALESLQRFYACFVLCVAVRNGDAHLKNFGLLYEHPAAAAPRLSPLYDVVTTAAYDDINVRTGQMQTDRTLALKLNKSTRYPNREQLVEFGKTFCLVRSPEKVIDRVCEAMTDSLSANRDRVDDTFFRRLQDEWDRGRESISPPRAPM